MKVITSFTKHCKSLEQLGASKNGWHLWPNDGRHSSLRWMLRRGWRRLRFPTTIYSLIQQTLSFSSWLFVAADCTCLSSKWRWQGLKIASHASLPVIHLAMGTPTHAAEVPSTTEEFEVPEYERLRQENLRKNSLKPGARNSGSGSLLEPLDNDLYGLRGGRRGESRQREEHTLRQRHQPRKPWKRLRVPKP